MALEKGIIVKKYGKRDASAELLRIFACMIVIGTHIKLSGRVVDG